MPYTVRFYTGDYIPRQQAANADKAIAYVEHHFNASTDPRAAYTCVIVGSNASAKSKAWGARYAAAVAREFVTTNRGVIVGGFGGRGDGNVRHTAMPAILLEPLFASNPNHAGIIRSDDGRERLARILAETIRAEFPNGGLVAFSVGHKYRTSKPNDRGAMLHGGGTEADCAEMVLKRAAAMLTAESSTCPTCGQEVRS